MRKYSKYEVKKNNTKARWFLCLVLSMVVILYSISYMDKIIRPNVASIAEVKVKSVISQIVNQAVKENFMKELEFTKLINVSKDMDGNVTFVETNGVIMNQISSALAIAAQEKFKNMEPISIKVPVGTIMGNQILSQIGPYVTLKVQPIGMAKVGFKTEFESCGINQTKYKVFLEFESEAKVLVPFAINNIHVSNTILMAEAII
ncbi:MAG: sporulation protein YunB, partial [Acetivibrio sp.]